MSAAPKPGVERSDTAVVDTANGPALACSAERVGAGPRSYGLAAPAGAGTTSESSSASTTMATALVTVFGPLRFMIFTPGVGCGGFAANVRCRSHTDPRRQCGWGHRLGREPGAPTGDRFPPTSAGGRPTSCGPGGRDGRRSTAVRREPDGNEPPGGGAHAPGLVNLALRAGAGSARHRRRDPL